jgi:hypothetical protein
MLADELAPTPLAIAEYAVGDGRHQGRRGAGVDFDGVGIPAGRVVDGLDVKGVIPRP